MSINPLTHHHTASLKVALYQLNLLCPSPLPPSPPHSPPPLTPQCPSQSPQSRPSTSDSQPTRPVAALPVQKPLRAPRATRRAVSDAGASRARV